MPVNAVEWVVQQVVEFIYNHEASIRLGAFLGFFGLFGLWELAAPARSLTQSKTGRWVSNLSLLVLSTVILRLVLPLAAVGAAWLADREHWGISNHVDIPMWLKTLAAFLLLDLLIYFQHMAFHVMPLMWRFHRVHHSDLDCDVTTGLRFHPVEIFISMVIKIAVIVSIGAPVLAVILFEIVLNVMSMFTHSNIRLPSLLEKALRWLVVTPDMHRIHHSVRENETNSNFGFHLSFWDRIFGTYMAQPKDGQQRMALGLDQFREPDWQKLFGLLRIPFAAGIRGYAINYRDTANADELELARELAIRNHEKALLATELHSYLQAIGQHALVSVTDRSGKILEANDRFCEVSGYRREELLGQNHRIIKSGKHPDSFYIEMWKTISSGRNWRGEVCNRAKNGAFYWVDSAIVPITDETGKIVRYISVRLDTTARKQYEENLQHAYQLLAQANSQLEQLSRIDGLTNIANRRHFDEILSTEIHTLSRIQAPLSLILCDIDYFKNYNDAYGHDAGDACLKAVAEAIKSSFTRANDLTARYGGEEFAVILPGIDHANAFALAENMRASIERLALKHDASKVADVVTVSVGLATLVPDKFTTVSTFVRKADEALYAAKAKGRNAVHVL